jgi:hypothetical protein
MFDWSFGPVLLLRPAPVALDWSLVAVGLFLGYVLPWHHLHAAYQPFCVGAAVFAIARDFGVPFDVAVLACVPVCLVRWGGGVLLPYTLVAATIVNYFVLAPDLPHVPTDPWAPAVAAFLFVARAPPVSGSKLVRIGLVVARYQVPRAAHVLYGGLLFVLDPLPVPGYDATVGGALAYTLCCILTQESWYAYLAVCVGLGATLLRVRI